MLRVSKLLLAASVATALIAGDPAFAQGQGGLAGLLETAEAKLTADTQSCTPINLGEYQSLLHQAAQNKIRANKAKKKNVPVDEAQVDADLAKASELFNRAQAALVQQCMRSAQQQPAQVNPQAAGTQQSSIELPKWANEILVAHNVARASVGAPPLVWNADIARAEQAWAEVQAERGTIEHRPREGRGNVRENLAQVPPGYTIAQTLDRWTRERSDFVPGIFPNVCKSGGGCSGVLHYSQMIWPDSTDIGCGKAEGRGGTTTVACGYGPGGNRDGKPVGLPVQIAENSTVRPRLVGGDYGGTTPASPVSNVDPGNTVRTAPLFDLGIYAGGAWTSDWFDVGNEVPMGETSALSFMINGLVDFGDDDGISGFVGGGIRVARVDYSNYNNVRVFFNDSTIDDSDVELARQLLRLGCSPTDSYCDTNMVAPTLPASEVYNTTQPAKNPKYDEVVRKHYEAVMKMASGTPYEQRVSALMAGWYLYATGKSGCDNAKVVAGEGQVRAALGALKQMKADMADVGEFAATDLEELTTTIEDYEALLNYHNPKGASPAQPTADADAGGPGGDPSAPALPNKEVFNPADWPQCPMDVM